MQKPEHILPQDIEARSFAIITEELGERTFPSELEPVIKRVIHATADFEYADNLVFTDGVIGRICDAVRRGACFVTDTQMAAAGINKRVLAKAGAEVRCFTADPDVAEAAKEKGITRSAAGIEKASQLHGPRVFVVGNAPTALLEIAERIHAGTLHPEAVIGVPVGFVNVVAAKERILAEDVPAIVARGRKGGSTVAAAIVNAILYELDPDRGRTDAAGMR